MKKCISMLLLISALALSGCGDDVSKEDYDKAVAERDEYEEKYKNCETAYELKQKISNYSIKAEKDREKILLIFSFCDSAGADTTEYREQFDGLYTQVTSAINAMDSLYNSFGNDYKEATGDGIEGITLDGINDIYNEYENCVNEICGSFIEIATMFEPTS